MKEAKTFILGTNVDRKLLEKVHDSINSDYDIRRLVHTAKSTLWIKVALLVFSVVLIVVSYWGQNFLENLKVLAPISVLTFISALIGFVSDFGSITKVAMTLPKYVRYIFSKKSPSHPADLWRHLQGSVADVQMYNTVKNILDDDNVKVIYAGEPYYKTEYIDYITVRWKFNKSKCKFFTWLGHMVRKIRFCKFYKEYSIQTNCSKADNQYFKNNNKMLERSNAVFGILFSSKYFHYELTKQNNSYISGVDINIDKEDKNISYKKFLSQEWIRYCIAPDIIGNGIKPNKQFRLEISDIVYGLGEETKWTRWKAFLNMFSANIHVPIKKIIAVRRTESIDKYTSIGNADNGVSYICIGGAEQNIALQAIINEYRWKYYDRDFVSIGTKGFRNELTVGFAENSFDSNNQVDFLAGTEGLVYGVRDDIFGRLGNKDKSSYKAELFRMDMSQNTEVFSVYGFSAMATKMALCQLCVATRETATTLDDEKKAKFDQYIPGEVKLSSDIIDYCLIDSKDGGSYADNIYASNEGKYWDENDLMNEGELLKSWFNGDVPEDYTQKNHISISY